MAMRLRADEKWESSGSGPIHHREQPDRASFFLTGSRSRSGAAHRRTFFRADLHIHSFGASHDVKDATMTIVGIVKTAVREGLSIIAITDHNEIGSIETTIREAQSHQLLVVPAVELSTREGHLLRYLPDMDTPHRFYAQLNFADRGKGTSRCQHSVWAASRPWGRGRARPSAR